MLISDRLDDPFGTATIRDRVLAGWLAGAARFREDANAEEDFALGGYRDRLIVELAQNAADAATRNGVPGRLLLALRRDDVTGAATLLAANTGAPLSAAGVEALCTLRASAKRDDEAVGHFGVGFCAVLAVTDEPAVVSRSGGVRFSAAQTRALITSGEPDTELAAELNRRDGQVPVLRLPFAVPDESPAGPPAIPDGYDSAVLLPLRDGSAMQLVRRLLAEVGDPLLLALPGLAEVIIELPDAPPRRLSDVGDRWFVVRRTGRLDPALLADRPTEERRRTAWNIAWALPTGDFVAENMTSEGMTSEGMAVPGRLFAPTATDEPLPWQALLIGSFPLESSRRHVAPGPATDELVRLAGATYAQLLHERAAAGHSIWSLVPVGLAAGVLDGALRGAVRDVLPDTLLLRPAGPSSPSSTVLIAGRDAVALDPPAGAEASVVAGLAPWLPGLIRAPRSAGAALDLLGVRRTTLADVVEQLPPDGEPEQWRELYQALSPLGTDPLAREALAALPVPLADGRVVRGVRGLVLPGGSSRTVAGPLAVLGVRVVHPDAAHTLLERLGAVQVSARQGLELPAVRAAIEQLHDDDDLAFDEPQVAGDRLTAALTLVAEAVELGELGGGELGGGELGGTEPGGAELGGTEPAWLAELELTDDEGEPTAAAGLVIPGSFAAQVFDPDLIPPVEAAVLERWGRRVLTAVGVLDDLSVLRVADVSLDRDAQPADPATDPAAVLDGFDDWVAAVFEAQPGDVDPSLSEVSVAELVAVRDLDAVRDEAWPQVLTRLSGHPALRAAVLRPTRVVTVGLRGTTSLEMPSYTAWWLRRRLVPGGGWADPDADPAITALLPQAPPALAVADGEFRRALGGVRSAADLNAAAVGALLDGLADPEVELDLATMLGVWSGLAGLVGSAELSAKADIAAPEFVRVIEGLGTRVVSASDAVVVDSPAWLQRRDLGPAVLAADRAAARVLAELFDLPIAGDLAAGDVDDDDTVTAPVPPAVLSLLPSAPATWCEHDDVLVDGFSVQWWVSDLPGPVVVHACTLDGLARGLAWAAGRWQDRLAVAAVLADPQVLGELMSEGSFSQCRRR